MEIFLGYLRSIGPFSTPLCVAMLFALRWLHREYRRVLIALDEANADRMKLREKRADDLLEAATEYRLFGEAQRATIDQLVSVSKKTLVKIGVGTSG